VVRTEAGCSRRNRTKVENFVYVPFQNDQDVHIHCVMSLKQLALVDVPLTKHALDVDEPAHPDMQGHILRRRLAVGTLWRATPVQGPDQSSKINQDKHLGREGASPIGAVAVTRSQKASMAASGIPAVQILLYKERWRKRPASWKQS
jgi:hypothetical protein